MITKNPREFIWEQAYRPTKIDDCILPIKTKAMFHRFREQGDLPNLILAGPPGTGKTSVAMATMDEIGIDYMKKNASKDNGIDVLRNDITEFASSVSFTGGRKIVILDEADGLSHVMQPALKAFFEDFSSNCGFILTCNQPGKIIKEIHSRCSLIDFTPPKEERADMMREMISRCVEILKNENVPYELGPIAALVKELFPDFRRTLGQLQMYAARNGKIDIGVVTMIKDKSIDTLIVALKAKKYNDMRKWVADNSDLDFHILCAKLYEYFEGKIEPQSIPVFISLLNQYDYKYAFVVNKEINLTAMLGEIMKEIRWKI